MQSPRACVLYARKSTDREDKQILSIPAQLQELREFAARSGLTITRELEESCSARKPGRLIFSRLLKDIEAGRVERVLSWRLDRLARNPVDGGQLIYMLGEGKLKELVTPEGTYNGAGDSKFVLSVQFGAATKMTDDLAAGVRRGNAAVMRSGRIPWRAPMGYIKVRAGRGFRGAGEAVPDPKLFPVVQGLWSDVLAGGTTAEAWRRALRQSGVALSFSHTYAILRNPFYAGIIRAPSGTYAGHHQAMVTPDEFERVQRLLRPASKPRLKHHQFVYSGLLRCGACGNVLVGERHEKPSGLVFVYYRCGRRQQGRPVCRAPAAKEETVTADVVRALEHIQLPEPLVNWTRDALELWATREEGSAAQRFKALDEQIAAAERGLLRLTKLLVAGTLRDESYVHERDEAELRIAQLKRAMMQPGAELAAWRTRVEELLEAGTTLSTTFSAADVGQRRRLVSRVCANLVVNDRITKPSLRFPFSLLDGNSEVADVANAAGANSLPAPKKVLADCKNARSQDDCERALLTWWTFLKSFRTGASWSDTAPAN